MLAIGAAPAPAATISFQSLAVNDNLFHPLGGPSVTIDGYVFSSPFLAIFGYNAGRHPVGGSASTSLFSSNPNSVITMTRAAPGTFSLTALDLADLNWDPTTFGPSFTTTIVGTRADLSTVSQMVTILRNAGLPVLDTFQLAGFTDLTSVQFTQGFTHLGTTYQFTNLDVQELPEPATWLLVASGAGLLLHRRRLARAGGRRQ
jgi:hypothetical protein